MIALAWGSCCGPHLDDRTGIYEVCPLGEDITQRVTCPDCKGRGVEHLSLPDGTVEKDFCLRCHGEGTLDRCDWCQEQQQMEEERD